MELPDTWSWDDHDLLHDTAAEQAAARHAEVVKKQVDSLDPDYLMALYTSDSVHMNE
jgi:hypothetical protein